MEVNRFKLTGREKDILDILWQSKKSLIASEIVNASTEIDNPITINTAQAVLKKLLKRELIKIDQIVYSGTVLSRSYIPTYEEKDFEIARICQDVKELKRFGITAEEFFDIYRQIEKIS